MKDMIRNTALLTVTCLVASGLLAAVYGVTKPKIDANKVRKEIDSLRTMVPEPNVWVGVSKDGVEIIRAIDGVTDGLTVEGVETWLGRSADGRASSKFTTSRRFPRTRQARCHSIASWLSFSGLVGQVWMLLRSSSGVSM